jgi:hypothetical protein
MCKVVATFQPSDMAAGEPILLEQMLYERVINPLMPELNPSMQCCSVRLFTGDFAF